MKHLFKPISLALCVISVFLVYCCSQALEWDSSGNGELIAHSYSVWGDWSAHFTFISNLLERGPHWLWGDSPLFSGTSFQYPFLSHVLTALYAWTLNLDVPTAVYSSSLILLFFLPFALHFFFRSFGFKRWTSYTTILLFLLIGGTQFLDSSLDPNEPLTNQFTKGSVFTQFIVFEIFPQRAFLFGMITFSLLAGLLIRIQKIHRLTLKQFVFFTLSLGLIPLLHLHTYIAVAVFLLFLFFFPIMEKSRIHSFKLGFSVALFSFIWIYLLLMRGEKTHQGNWDIWFPGWAQNPKADLKGAMAMNPVSFWVYNTGLFLPLAGVGFYFLRKNKQVYALFGSGALLFLVAICFNIQPWFYDNMKLFTYSFLFLAPFAAYPIQLLFERSYAKVSAIIMLAPENPYPVELLIERKYTKIAAIVLVAFQCTSGFMDLRFLAAKKQNAQFFSQEEFELADKFKALRSSPDDLVLIVPKHNHWVPCLSGNPVVMGSVGWLWSWGIDYAPREQEVQKIFSGEPETPALVKALHIRYIVANRTETMGDKPINFMYLQDQYPVVLEQGDWFVFAVN
jgi:hypothetical protein